MFSIVRVNEQNGLLALLDASKYETKKIYI